MWLYFDLKPSGYHDSKGKASFFFDLAFSGYKAGYNAFDGPQITWNYFILPFPLFPARNIKNGTENRTEDLNHRTEILLTTKFNTFTSLLAMNIVCAGRNVLIICKLK